MVLIRNDPRKEATYGWYPPGTNVYRPKNAPKAYDKEYLFKSFDRRSLQVSPSIHTTAGRQNPQMSLKSVGPPSSPTPLLAVTGYRAPTIAPSKGAKGTADTAETLFQSRASSAMPMGHAVDRIRSSRTAMNQDMEPRMQPIPTPSRAELGLRPYPSSESISIAFTPTSSAADLKGSYRGRAKSALEPRGRSSDSGPAFEFSPDRPLRPMTTVPRSKDSRRATSSREVGAAHLTSEPLSASEGDLLNVDCQSSDAGGRPGSLPTAEDDRSAGYSATPDLAPTTISYEHQLTKYGWRAEIPGDPLKLKKITERLPYTVSCTEPIVRPDPPEVCVMDNNTFFYNTIPKRPMSFTVHPEWQSELFVAKRIDLEKRGVAKFHTRNFAFAY